MSCPCIVLAKAACSIQVVKGSGNGGLILRGWKQSLYGMYLALNLLASCVFAVRHNFMYPPFHSVHLMHSCTSRGSIQHL